MATRKAITLTSYLTDKSSAEVCFLSDFRVFTAFSGLRTLNTRIDFRAESDSVWTSITVMTKSNMAAFTIRKSITFHGSLRYVFFPKMKPLVNILSSASMMKTTEKT